MKSILVTGATGHQGNAIVRSLLATNGTTTSNEAPSIPEPTFTVVALTRDPSSSAAKALKALDPARVDLVQCNLNDEKETRGVFERYKGAGEGLYGAVMVLPFPGLGKSGAGTERNGKLLIDCAIDHAVKHFVYSSVDRGGGLNDDERTLDVAAKIANERYLKKRAEESGMYWTILLPGFFMLNFLGSIGKITAAVLREGVKPDTKVQLVAVEDIGRMAGVVLEQPDRYSSKAITVASESLTASERDAAYRRAVGSSSSTTGLPSVPAFLARTLLYLNQDTKDLCADIERVHQAYLASGNGGRDANLKTVRDALREVSPLSSNDGPEGMMSFETFCAKNYPGGRVYRVKEDDNRKKEWNGLSVGGLVKDGVFGSNGMP